MHDASELSKSSGKRAGPSSCFTNQSGYRIQWGHKLLGTFHSLLLWAQGLQQLQGHLPKLGHRCRQLDEAKA